MQLQRKTDKFVRTARELSSRGMSFIILMLGVILQASHTTLLMYDIAAFRQNWLKFIIGLGIGLFISSALAVFTLKYDGKNVKVKQIIQIFFWFEIFTNCFYYFNSLIFSKGIETATLQNWLYLIIAMPFSFIVPYAIKQFADIINADEKIAMGSIDVDEQIELSNEATELVNEQLKSIQEKIDNLNIDELVKKNESFELTVGDKSSIAKIS